MPKGLRRAKFQNETLRGCHLSKEGLIEKKVEAVGAHGPGAESLRNAGLTHVGPMQLVGKDWRLLTAHAGGLYGPLAGGRHLSPAQLVGAYFRLGL